MYLTNSDGMLLGGGGYSSSSQNPHSNNQSNMQGNVNGGGGGGGGHCELEISNISNVKEVTEEMEGYNELNHPLKDSIDMELSNILIADIPNKG